MTLCFFLQGTSKSTQLTRVGVVHGFRQDRVTFQWLFPQKLLRSVPQSLGSLVHDWACPGDLDRHWDMDIVLPLLTENGKS